MEFVSCVHFQKLLHANFFQGLEQSSSDLVPGDIVNLSQSQFHTFPADMFLLCGDAIINESMLTGESVPVSKTALKDEEIARWKDVDDVTPEMAKGFLYSGTRVIRIRGGLGDGGYTKPALAVVTRTGENPSGDSLLATHSFQGSIPPKGHWCDRCCSPSQ